MRATRLINILTTLQARGQVNATALAEENGVSLRTIYRDIDELAAAGIPVYSERGAEGGYRLLEGYRVRLNGLSTEEAETLFFSGLPGPAATLGLGSIMTAANKKLTVALPEHLRKTASDMRARFHLDTSTWFDEPEEPRFIQDVARAVWRSRVVRMHYKSWHEENMRTVHPLGLVLKNNVWYMVADFEKAPRTYRVSRIRALTVTEQGFQRPENFDLAVHWDESSKRLEKGLHSRSAKVRVSDLGFRILTAISPAYVRDRMKIGECDAVSGWRTVELPVNGSDEAAFEFLRLGREVEVMAPASLREAMRKAAADIAAHYD